jgi:hypothetical protein
MTLLTEEYRALLAAKHDTGGWKDPAAAQYVDFIVQHALELGENTLLDYGSGGCGLSRVLQERFPGEFTVTEYEPSRDDLMHNNTPHNYVVSIDVLEHIEPDLLDNVLDDLKRVTLKGGYFTVSTRAAGQKLPDGRNAHLIIKPFAWWKEHIQKRFTIVEEDFSNSAQRGFFFVKPLEE